SARLLPQAERCAPVRQPRARRPTGTDLARTHRRLEIVAAVSTARLHPPLDEPRLSRRTPQAARSSGRVDAAHGGQRVDVRAGADPQRRPGRLVVARNPAAESRYGIAPP